jgi:Aldo/keto reductase family
VDYVITSLPYCRHSELPSTFVPNFHNESDVRRMRYNKLGSTGMHVSALAVGGGGLERFYRSLDEDHAIESIHQALRLGLNYIHTAPWYGGGKSEALLGKVHVLREIFGT